MIKLLIGNPWLLLGLTAALVTWSTLIGVKAYSMGSNACEAAYLAAEQEQQRLEAEAAAKVVKKRHAVRKEIKKTGRKITNEARKHEDDKPSNALRSYRNGLYERWRKDHK